MVTKSVKKSWPKNAKKKTSSNAKPKANLTSLKTAAMVMAMATHRLTAHRQPSHKPDLGCQKGLQINKYVREQLLYR